MQVCMCMCLCVRVCMSKSEQRFFNLSDDKKKTLNKPDFSVFRPFPDHFLFFRCRKRRPT